MNHRRLLPLCLTAFLSLAIPATSFIGCTSRAATTTAPAATTQPGDLLSGAKWQFSDDGGKTFTAAPADPRPSITVLAKADFDVADPAAYPYLELSHTMPIGTKFQFKLNDKAVAGPLEGMFYKVIPAIDAKFLKKGANALTVEAPLDNAVFKAFKGGSPAALRGLTDKDLAIQTGPMLGGFGEDYFSVTLRTNIPAVVTLTAEPIAFTTGKTPSEDLAELTILGGMVGQERLFHRFRVSRDPKQIGFKLRLRATAGGQDVVLPPWEVSFPAAEKNGKLELQFVCFGDSRTNVKDWTKVAAAVEKAKPQFTVFVGDMITDGRDDNGWDSEWFTPAKDLLRTVPTMVIYGNHEHNATILDNIFYTPSADGKGHNWTQQIGNVLVVGIDGGQDWSAGGANAKWLDKTLADAKADFIIVGSHYPIYTSGTHGLLGLDGKPLDKGIRQGQETILPILTKHKVSLFIAGHDHIYERSELPGGLPHLILGGAGAPLYPKAKGAAKQNPYSKVFESVLHYGLFEVKDDVMTFTALTPEGKKIDSLELKARSR